MKFKLSLLFLAAFTFLGLGCASEEKRADTVIEKEVGEVNASTPQSWNERKNEFINQSDARINAISKDVSQMEKSKNKLDRDQRKKAEDAIGETKDILKDIKEELGDLKKVDAEDWEEERLEFLSKLNQLEERYTSAKNLLN